MIDNIVIPSDVHKDSAGYTVTDIISKSEYKLPNIVDADKLDKVSTNSKENITHYILVSGNYAKAYEALSNEKMLWCHSFMMKNQLNMLKRELSVTFDFSDSIQAVTEKCFELLSDNNVHAVQLDFDNEDTVIVEEEGDVNYPDAFVEVVLTPLIRIDCDFFEPETNTAESLVSISINKDGRMSCTQRYVTPSNVPKLANSTINVAGKSIGFTRYIENKKS